MSGKVSRQAKADQREYFEIFDMLVSNKVYKYIAFNVPRQGPHCAWQRKKACTIRINVLASLSSRNLAALRKNR
jgi:hypothetical protein